MNRLQQNTVLGGLLLGACAVLSACGSSSGGGPSAGTGGAGLGEGGGFSGSGGGIGAGGSVTGSGGTGNGGFQTQSGGSGNGGGSTGGGAATGGTTAGGAGGGGGACDTTTGTWAIDFKTNVSWAATAVLAAGSGSQELKMLSHRTASGTTVTDTAQICSVTIPSFATILNTKIEIVFPSAAFGGPPVNTTLTTTISGSGQGSTFTSADTAVLVGGTLANPLTDPWPCFGSANGCSTTYPSAPTGVSVTSFSVDADGDGKPGVTADATPQGGSCSTCTLVPTLYGPTADQLYLAFITIASASGTMDSCTHGSGPLDLKSINQSILGCHNSDGSGDCSTNQVQYVNDNSPDWKPATGGTIAMTKLGDTASCTDVASATF